MQLTQQERRFEANARLGGGGREALGQLERPRLAGLVRGGEHQATRDVSPAVEAPGCQSQGVLPAAPSRRLDGVTEAPAQRSRLPRGQTGPYDVAVERVGHERLQPLAVSGDVDHPSSFEGVEIGKRLDAPHHIDPQRLAQRENLEDLAIGLPEAGEAGLDQLHQPGRRRERPLEAPQTLVPTEHARLGGAEHQFLQQQDVASGAGKELMDRRPVDRRAQCGLQQLPGLRKRELRQLQPLGETVLPEGGDGVAGRLAAAQGDEEEDLRAAGQLMGESRRSIVELVGVVDEEGDGSSLATRPYRSGQLAEHHAAIGRVGDVGDEAGEGTEGQRRCGLRR